MTQTSPVRVRFAPSPTGYLHVGGARTALFNWLYARHTGGTFILRIEDTDFERSTQEMVEGILVGMRWLGLDWDEGPYFQSQRLELYRATAKRLVQSGHAYDCFCSKQPHGSPPLAEGAPPLAGFAKAGVFTAKDDDPCRCLSREEAERRRAQGEAAAVRFAVPESGSTGFDDAVFGPIEISNTEIEDFVLLRSDGVPTYHLGVVADDIDMQVTHIIRGADHLSNTPKQRLIYEALGEPLPVFAHVPLILGPDKTRLSKRHGATSVTAYKDEGFLPEAFRNYLALLGWSPPDATKEIVSDQELISLFSLEGISKSNAVFDRTKLEWMNAEYIRALPVDELSDRLLPIVRAAGYSIEACKLRQITPLIRERIKLLRDVLTAADFFLLNELPPYDTALLIPQKGDLAMASKALERAREVLAQTDFNHQALDEALRSAAKEMGLKPGQMFQPIRVAVTGRTASPPLFETLEVLGRETSLARISRAIDKIPS
ncbi:MAG TPA: glutamate--tRNA ligase [Terriglobales bacterium]|nr:glutamate--tRNA ligase [Terriglobales bacterium]